jgi:hypothetical protein
MPLREAVFGTTPRGTPVPLLVYTIVCLALFGIESTIRIFVWGGLFYIIYRWRIAKK